MADATKLTNSTKFTNSTNPANSEIDENLYSRQLYVLGHDAMKKMSKSDILICGCDGLGLEIAKNIILGGVRSVTIYDNQLVYHTDLATQYYSSEVDLGKPRVTNSIKKLAELNPNVKVEALTDKDGLTKEQLLQYHVLIVANASFKTQLVLSEIAHANNIKLICASTHGLAGQIFCDFGSEFVVNDTDGEPVSTSHIANIVCNVDDKNSKRLVFVIETTESTPHGLMGGDHIKISNIVVSNDTTINLEKNDPVKIHTRSKYELEFVLEFDSEETAVKTIFKYINGGTISQVKIPKILNFEPLAKSVENPVFVPDLSDPVKNQSLHFGFRALSAFAAKHNRLPKTYNTADATELYNIATTILKQPEKIKLDQDLITKISFTARGQTCPIQSVIGSIVGQEAMKACSGKFHPIHQWLYYEAFDILDLKNPPIACLIDNYQHLVKKTEPKSELGLGLEPVQNKKGIDLNRYESQLRIFGPEFQAKLKAAHLFVVGAGAIGCELLKNFAMAGVGNIIITDMDTIERSNLNRQFLFRPNHIGELKSKTAAKVAMSMNPDIKVIAHQNKVSIETQNIYNEGFFNNLTCVANALDNVDARLYVDSLCVANKKPLLESGTLGTKGNVQVILPHLTESYGSSQDPPEKSIPICTIKNFPYIIDHTIQHARDMFEGLFNQAPLNVNKYFENPTMLQKLSSTEFSSVTNDLLLCLKNIPANIDDCIKFGFKQWHELYRNQTLDLLDKFPADYKTEHGALFWSGTKKCPHALLFNVENPVHIEWISAYSKLWAEIYNIKFDAKKTNAEYIVQLLKSEPVPPYAKQNKNIAANEKEQKEQMEKAAAELEQEKDTIISQINDLGKNKIMMEPIQFEKDDDTNYHIQFITSASNLRAEMYEIQPADSHTTKGIAGKIIPAIATTTSLVSGLVVLEYFKLVVGLGKKEDMPKFRNSFVNLALPFYGFSEPMPAKSSKIHDFEFTFWDSLDVKDPKMNISQLIEYFKSKYKFNTDLICYNQYQVFSDFIDAKVRERRLTQTVTEALCEILKTSKENLPNPINLTLSIDDEDVDENADIPMVRYYH